ncbi:hypothetical protein [Streptomyces sp. NPDC001450]
MLTSQPRFRLLGPLEVQLDGGAVALTGRPSVSAARLRAPVGEVRRALGSVGTGLLATQKLDDVSTARSMGRSSA